MLSPLSLVANAARTAPACDSLPDIFYRLIGANPPYDNTYPPIPPFPDVKERTRRSVVADAYARARVVLINRPSAPTPRGIFLQVAARALVAHSCRTDPVVRVARRNAWRESVAVIDQHYHYRYRYHNYYYSRRRWSAHARALWIIKIFIDICLFFISSLQYYNTDSIVTSIISQNRLNSESQKFKSFSEHGN